MRSLFLSLVSIRRNPYQSLVAIFSIFFTFFFSFVFSFLMYFCREALNFLETKPQIIAFFKTDITDAQASQSAQLIAEMDYINDLKIISKQDAFQSYKADNEHDQLLMELVTPDILPVSLEISTKDLQDLTKLDQELKKNNQIEEIFYQKDVIDNLNYWLDVVRIFSLIIFSCLGFLSLLVLILVISMKATNKRKNITIMKSIGASNFYIRSPFLWEGIIYGLIGALLAWTSSYALIIFNQVTLEKFFNTIKIFPISYHFLLIQLGSGIGISCSMGFIAAFWSVNRMIKK